MKIDILTRDGSPLGVTPDMIYGDDKRIGVGGSEIALLTMCEYMAKEGHQVRLYNDPLDKSSEKYGFEQFPLYAYMPQEDRDVLLNFRSPNDKVLCSKGKKVWWSCDQYTIGSFANFSKEVDRIITISPFHKDFFANRYGINDVYVTDLPVRLDDYDMFPEISRINNRFIFNSVPDRGLQAFSRIWNIISRTLLDAHVIITSDYRLWGGSQSGTEKYRMEWASFPKSDSFEYLGGIGRCAMIKQQLMAEYCLYPCIYDELFCISAAENQVAGVKTVSTNKGALATTNMFATLAIDATDPRNDVTFANKIFEMIQKKEESDLLALEVQKKAKERFDPKNIVKKWVTEVFE